MTSSAQVVDLTDEDLTGEPQTAVYPSEQPAVCLIWDTTRLVELAPVLVLIKRLFQSAIV